MQAKQSSQDLQSQDKLKRAENEAEELVITGMGHDHPEQALDNQFFADLQIGSSADWVEERTGIQNRYSVLDAATIIALRKGEASLQSLRQAGKVPSIAQLAVKPWHQAHQRATSFPTHPELLICGTSIPDYYIPANASVIAASLGLSCTTLDAHTACSSFVSNLAIAKGLLADGLFASAALFNIERYTLAMNYQEKSSCVLFGDGAAVTLLEKGRRKSGLKVLDVLLRSDPSGYDCVSIPAGGLFSQAGSRVQKFAISKTCEISEEILAKNHLISQDLAYFVGHQANLRMLTSACQRLNIPASKHLYNVATHGNQGAAGAPAVLSSQWPHLKAGDLVLVAVVGSGLTWGAALLQFQQF